VYFVAPSGDMARIQKELAPASSLAISLEAAQRAICALFSAQQALFPDHVSNHAAKRTQASHDELTAGGRLQETQRLLQQPDPGISASPHDNNPRYFNVIISGPQDSAYHGKSRPFRYRRGLSPLRVVCGGCLILSRLMICLYSAY